MPLTKPTGLFYIYTVTIHPLCLCVTAPTQCLTLTKHFQFTPQLFPASLGGKHSQSVILASTSISPHCNVSSCTFLSICKKNLLSLPHLPNQTADPPLHAHQHSDHCQGMGEHSLLKMIYMMSWKIGLSLDHIITRFASFASLVIWAFNEPNVFCLKFHDHLVMANFDHSKERFFTVKWLECVLVD